MHCPDASEEKMRRESERHAQRQKERKREKVRQGGRERIRHTKFYISASIYTNYSIYKITKCVIMYKYKYL